MTHFSQKQEDGMQHIKFIQTMENKNEKKLCKIFRNRLPFSPLDANLQKTAHLIVFFMIPLYWHLLAIHLSFARRALHVKPHLILNSFNSYNENAEKKTKW